MPVAKRGSGSGPLEVLRVALLLGLTSFGGPVAHVGYFRREYVERRRWLDEAAFGDLLALCQALPGPASSQLGIAIGTRRAGPLGGLAAWIGFSLPSAVILVAFGMLAGSLDLADAGWVHGLKLAAVAVVAHAVIGMAGSLAPDRPRRALALAAAAVALAWGAPLAQVAIIVGGGVLGLALLSTGAVPRAAAAPSPISPRAGVAALVAFAILLVGLPLASAVDGQPVAVFESYYRSGSLVFGGGHVVLPLLHGSVVDPGWVTEDRFLAGYGAAQAVPGPLFSFAAYLGTVTDRGPNGVAGGLLALVAIFLPSFLLVFGALPFWDRLQASARFRQALSGTSAAVVGLLLAALYRPVATEALGGPADLGVAAAGLGLLLSGRVPPIVVVALAAGAGQLMG